MKQLLLSILLTSLTVIPAWPASYLMLTDLGSSAEMIGKGNIEGFNYTSNSVFENPAGLRFIDSLSVSAFTTTIMEEVNYINASVAYNTQSYGTIGLGYMSAGVTDIPFTKAIVSNGAPNGTRFVQDGSFEYKNTVMKLSYSYPFLKNIHLGASLGIYSNKIHEITGTGMGIDVGMIYKLGDILISLQGKNIGSSTITYKAGKAITTQNGNSTTTIVDENYEATETLPLQTVFGLLYELGEFDVLGQLKFDGTNSLVSVGTTYTPGFLMDILSFSIGYKEYSVLDAVKNTLTLGMGLDLYGINLNYAYEKSDHIEFDSNNYFSMSFNL